jgi:hypothetical protein
MGLLGDPGIGFHTHFWGVAWRDVVATIVVGILLSYFFKVKAIYAVGAFFLLGIVLHRAFNVRTTLDKLLFP